MTGWEYYGVKFSMLITMLASVVMFIGVWVESKKSDHFTHVHVDTMAGDEGED